MYILAQFSGVGTVGASNRYRYAIHNTKEEVSKSLDWVEGVHENETGFYSWISETLGSVPKQTLPFRLVIVGE